MQEQREPQPGALALEFGQRSGGQIRVKEPVGTRRRARLKVG
jgi:hypothetical protein